MSKKYTEGIAGDGAAILDNGGQITITEILNRLNENDKLKKQNQGLRELVKAYAKAHAANPCDPDVTDDQVEAEDKLRKAIILNPVANL